MKEGLTLKSAGWGVLLAGGYFAAAKLGLLVASVHVSATPVWPPTGIAFAGLFLLGYRFWPAIWVGAFLANITTAGTVFTTIGIASGNTLEGLAGVWLIRRFTNGRNPFHRPRDFFLFVVLASGVSTLISPTLGVTSLALGRFAEWSAFRQIWVTWWLGDASGDLLIAPLLVLWCAEARAQWTRRQRLEAALLLATVVLVGQAVFGGSSFLSIQDNPLAFICLPPLIWAAFRFGPREAITAIVVLGSIAISGTLQGHGPYAKHSPNASLLLLEAFLGVNAVMVMALATVVRERERAAEEQRKSDERFKQIAEAITEVFYLTDVTNGKMIYVSPAYETLWGRTCESLYADPRSFLESILPEHRPRVIQAMERQQKGEITEEEYALRRTGGKLRWIRDRSFPLRDETGRIHRITGIAEDITERKRAQEALDRANAQVTSILNSITDGFMALDPQWNLTFLNPHAEQIFSRLRKAPRELLGKSLFGQFPDLAESRLGEEFRRAVAQQAPVVLEFFHPPQAAWFDFHVYPSSEGLAVYFNDITERKQAETARGQLADIVESSDDAIISKTLEGLITSWNAGAEKIFGYATHEILGREMMILVPPDRKEEEEQILGRIARGEHIHHFETVRTRKDMRLISVSVTMSPIQDAQGRIIGTSTIARDITERTRAEAKLKEALKEKEVMLAEINHRVKNNLQIISSFLFLQSEQIRDPSAREMFRESQNRLRSMAMVHENLYQSPNLSRIDFGPYVRNLTADLLRSYGVGPGTVNCKVNIAPTLFGVDLAVMCGLIINELVSNSLKHAFPGGRRGEIRIDLAEQGDRTVTLTVRDDGVGFAEGVDFRQTNTLGMQIVNGLVKQLKGTIKRQEGPGAGFEIIFNRPASR